MDKFEVIYTYIVSHTLADKSDEGSAAHVLRRTGSIEAPSPQPEEDDRVEYLVSGVLLTTILDPKTSEPQYDHTTLRDSYTDRRIALASSDGRWHQDRPFPHDTRLPLSLRAHNRACSLIVAGAYNLSLNACQKGDSGVVFAASVRVEIQRAGNIISARRRPARRWDASAAINELTRVTLGSRELGEYVRAAFTGALAPKSRATADADFDDAYKMLAAQPIDLAKAAAAASTDPSLEPKSETLSARARVRAELDAQMLGVSPNTRKKGKKKKSESSAPTDDTV